MKISGNEADGKEHIYHGRELCSVFKAYKMFGKISLKI